MSGPGPSSRGAPWAEDDYAEMVALLRAGGSDAEVAAALGRSVGSLEHRAQMMLPVGHAREDVLAALRERLAGDASYDWRTPVQAALDAKGYHFWTRAEEAVLAEGWVAAIPMRDLVDQLGLPEPAIIGQLVGLHLAADTDEVAARIGLVPGGDMELRGQLASDRDAAFVWCLAVVTGQSPPEISLHASQDSAEQARDAVVAALRSGQSVRWSIAKRRPGDGARGHTLSGRADGP